MGPTGNYLSHPHTIRHMREPFYSSMMDKGVYAQWEKKGKKSMEQLAAERIDQILKGHKVQAELSEDVRQAISNIVAREQQWINTRD